MNEPLKKQKPEGGDDAPLMPFNEALKRVWAAPPMPKVKPKLDGEAKKPRLQVKAGHFDTKVSDAWRSDKLQWDEDDPAETKLAK